MLKITNSNKPASEKTKAQIKKALGDFRKRTEIGFQDLPRRKELWAEASSYGQKLAREFDTMVVLGIGGSSMGGRVIKEVLEPTNGSKIEFWDNVDGIEFERNWAAIGDLKKVCWVVISKSGSTIETLALADLVLQEYQAQNLNFAKHFTIVSEPESNTLTDWAQKNGIAQLDLPVDVGGRFSVLTPVGLLPAAFVGVDIEEMRQGAELATEAEEELIAFCAQYLESFDRGEWVSVFWFYCSSLRWFGSWTQQLWAESLGKKHDRQNQPAPRVSTPLSCIGASDQHSILQQVMEGHKDKFVCFVRIKSVEQAGPILKQSQFPAKQQLLEGKALGELLAAEAEATYQALSESGVSSMVLEMNQLKAKELSYLFMFFQMATAVLGESLAINAFDQPGVELGKRLARSILQK